MSWATCYSGSNNIHFNTPPLMEDGRQFTNFDPTYKANSVFKGRLGIKSNYDYRQWLIKNGKSVIHKNYHSACDETSPCVKEAIKAPAKEKYLYKSCADMSTPYGYEGSDLKNMYLSRQALQSTLQAPIMTQEQLLIARASK